MFQSTGLTLPDCACFHKKAKTMNAAIDALAVTNIIQIRADMAAMNLCLKSDDYFIAALIWSCLAAIIYRKPDDKGQMCFEDYAKEYEAAYERLKPLVMQRLVYADGATQ